MSVHAEVLALRERLGISYKDASHRLYMTECEKLKTDEKTQKAFSILKDRTREALVSFQKRLVQIGEPAKSLNADPDADDFET
jgi:hypothetical protein